MARRLFVASALCLLTVWCVTRAETAEGKVSVLTSDAGSESGERSEDSRRNNDESLDQDSENEDLPHEYAGSTAAAAAAVAAPYSRATHRPSRQRHDRYRLLNTTGRLTASTTEEEEEEEEMEFRIPVVEGTTSKTTKEGFDPSDSPSAGSASYSMPMITDPVVVGPGSTNRFSAAGEISEGSSVLPTVTLVSTATTSPRASSVSGSVPPRTETTTPTGSIGRDNLFYTTLRSWMRRITGYAPPTSETSGDRSDLGTPTGNRTTEQNETSPQPAASSPTHTEDPTGSKAVENDTEPDSESHTQSNQTTGTFLSENATARATPANQSSPSSSTVPFTHATGDHTVHENQNFTSPELPSSEPLSDTESETNLVFSTTTQSLNNVTMEGFKNVTIQELSFANYSSTENETDSSLFHTTEELESDFWGTTENATFTNATQTDSKTTENATLSGTERVNTTTLATLESTTPTLVSANITLTDFGNDSSTSEIFSEARSHPENETAFIFSVTTQTLDDRPFSGTEYVTASGTDTGLESATTLSFSTPAEALGNGTQTESENVTSTPLDSSTSHTYNENETTLLLSNTTQELRNEISSTTESETPFKDALENGTSSISFDNATLFETTFSFSTTRQSLPNATLVDDKNVKTTGTYLDYHSENETTSELSNTWHTLQNETLAASSNATLAEYSTEADTRLERESSTPLSSTNGYTGDYTEVGTENAPTLEYSSATHLSNDTTDPDKNVTTATELHGPSGSDTTLLDSATELENGTSDRGTSLEQSLSTVSTYPVTATTVTDRIVTGNGTLAVVVATRYSLENDSHTTDDATSFSENGTTTHWTSDRTAHFENHTMMYPENNTASLLTGYAMHFENETTERFDNEKTTTVYTQTIAYSYNETTHFDNETTHFSKETSADVYNQTITDVYGVTGSSFTPTVTEHSSRGETETSTFPWNLTRAPSAFTTEILDDVSASRPSSDNSTEPFPTSTSISDSEANFTESSRDGMGSVATTAVASLAPIQSTGYEYSTGPVSGYESQTVGSPATTLQSSTFRAEAATLSTAAEERNGPGITEHGRSDWETTTGARATNLVASDTSPASETPTDIAKSKSFSHPVTTDFTKETDYASKSTADLSKDSTSHLTTTGKHVDTTTEDIISHTRQLTDETTYQTYSDTASRSHDFSYEPELNVTSLAPTMAENLTGEDNIGGRSTWSLADHSTRITKSDSDQPETGSVTSRKPQPTTIGVDSGVPSTPRTDDRHCPENENMLMNDPAPVKAPASWNEKDGAVTVVLQLSQRQIYTSGVRDLLRVAFQVSFLDMMNASLTLNADIQSAEIETAGPLALLYLNISRVEFKDFIVLSFVVLDRQTDSDFKILASETVLGVLEKRLDFLQGKLCLNVSSWFPGTSLDSAEELDGDLEPGGHGFLGLRGLMGRYEALFFVLVLSASACILVLLLGLSWATFRHKFHRNFQESLEARRNVKGRRQTGGLDLRPACEILREEKLYLPAQDDCWVVPLGHMPFHHDQPLPNHDQPPPARDTKL